MPLAEELLRQLHEGRDLRSEGCANPLSEARLSGFTGVRAVDFEKLFLKQHGPVHLVVEFGQLLKNIALSF